MSRHGYRVWVARVGVGISLLAALPADAHAPNEGYHNAAGVTVALGAVNTTTTWGAYTGLFEFYLHTAGAVETHTDPNGLDPDLASAGEPWVAAMYYPFYGKNNITVFKALAPDKVDLDPALGGTVRFSMPGLGSVKLVLSGSSATPRTAPFAFTTPEQHHGHTWRMSGAIVRGKLSSVTGRIKKGSYIQRIVPLRIDGELIAWIGEAAVIGIESS